MVNRCCGCKHVSLSDQLTPVESTRACVESQGRGVKVQPGYKGCAATPIADAGHTLIHMHSGAPVSAQKELSKAATQSDAEQVL